MTRKNLLVSAIAAAVLAAFNPAFAGGAKHGSADNTSSPSATTEQTLPSPEQGASGNDVDVGAGVSVDRATGDTERNADASSGSDSSISSSAGASSDVPQDEKRSVDQDRLTGLDRAHPAN